MSYKQEIADYKQKAIEIYQGHLTDLEKNILLMSSEKKDSKTPADYYIDYQESTIKLIEGKLKIDNEFIKEINITNLQKYQDLSPEKFEQLKEKIIGNHRIIVSQLKDKYEELAVISRENIKYQLAEINEDSDLNVVVQDPEEFFPKKMKLLTLSFIALFILFTAIVVLLYLYILN